MKLTDAYLLGIHPDVKKPPAHISEADRDVWLRLPGGLTWGVFALSDHLVELPEFWRERIEHVYAQFAPRSLGPYTLNLSLVHLKLAALPEIVALKSEFPHRTNELYARLFPPAQEPRRSGEHAYPSILFCQPDPAEFSRPAQDLASEAVKLMGFDACAVLPAVLDNAIFVGGPYSLSEYKSVGAFATEGPAERKHIAIPRIVHDCLLYQSLIYIMEDLDERVGRIPFVQQTVAGYLSKLKKARRKTPSYSERFLTYLADSEQTAIEFKASEDLRRVIESGVATNHFANAESTASTIRVRMPPLVYGSVIEQVVGEYRKAAADVTNDLTIGTERQKSIGDLLRDAANAEATLVNLRLQRFVIALAVITLLVSLVALGPGMLTDRQKEVLWHEKPSPTPVAPEPPPKKPLPQR
jgi:hypothetical protein